ncbi:hypothetical protein J3E69DRAFT_221630 [Trichoderma sp. SZMC 28015]
MLPNLPKRVMSLAHKQLKSHRSPRQPECNQTVSSIPREKIPWSPFAAATKPFARFSLPLQSGPPSMICSAILVYKFVTSHNPLFPKNYLTSMLPHNLFVCTVTRTCNEQTNSARGSNNCARTDLEGDDKPPKPTSREHRRMHWGFAACFLLAKKRPLLFMSAPQAAVNSGSVGRGLFFFVCLSIFGSGPNIRSILVSARAQGIDKYRTGLTIRCVLVRGQCKLGVPYSSPTKAHPWRFCVSNPLAAQSVSEPP